MGLKRWSRIMREKRWDRFAIVMVVIILLSLVGYFVWPLFGEYPRYIRAYSRVPMGMTEPQVRALYSGLASPTSFEVTPRSKARGAPQSARTLLIASSPGGGSWVYGYYLDVRGRVIEKYKFLD